ncbi:MAG: hypothetical protein ACLQIB_06265 [Isosphaeraceae bacterium]
MMTMRLNRRSPRADRQVHRCALTVEALEKHLALSPTLPLPPPGPVVALVAYHPPQPCISQGLSFHPPNPCISQGPSLEPPDPCISQGLASHPPSPC